MNYSNGTTLSRRHAMTAWRRHHCRRVLGIATRPIPITWSAHVTSKRAFNWQNVRMLD